MSGGRRGSIPVLRDAPADRVTIAYRAKFGEPSVPRLLPPLARTAANFGQTLAGVTGGGASFARATVQDSRSR